MYVSIIYPFSMMHYPGNGNKLYISRACLLTNQSIYIARMCMCTHDAGVLLVLVLVYAYPMLSYGIKQNRKLEPQVRISSDAKKCPKITFSCELCVIVHKLKLCLIFTGILQVGCKYHAIKLKYNSLTKVKLLYFALLIIPCDHYTDFQLAVSLNG